jgi:hypothetical protein
MTPRERLAFLAKKLREPLPEDIIFSLWAWHRKHSCGTTACAMGLAATYPELQAEGLRLLRKSNGRAGTPPAYGRVSGIDAAVTFFGIPQDAALRFFAPATYADSWSATPVDVANRIDQWLAEHPETAP